MPKNKVHVDRRLTHLKQDEMMRDLYKYDPRDSARVAGEFFHMMADTVKAKPVSPTAKLFRAADLNPEHPFAWGYLLDALAEVHFVNRPAGRRKVQDKDFKRKLKANVKEIMKARTKATNDHHLAILLQKRHGLDYPAIKTIEGFVSLLKRHKIAAADIWARIKPRKRIRPTQGSALGETVKPARVRRVGKIQD